MAPADPLHRYADPGGLTGGNGEACPIDCLQGAIETGRDVTGISDAVLSWALLAPGGVMAFDDYWWSGMPREQDQPRFAVDSFLACFLGQYHELHRGYQVVIQK